MLFGEKFKRASKNITVSEKVLDDTRQKMLLQAPAPIKRKKHFVKATVSFAAIATITCAGMIGTQFFNPSNQPEVQQAENNLFSISAFAYEQQENGQLKQKEINLLQEEAYSSEIIIAIRDGEDKEYEVTQIKMLGIKCEGENIAKVDFTIDNGVLKVPNYNWSKEKLLTNLESRGKTLTVDYEKGALDEIYWESDPFRVKIDMKEGAKPYSKDTQTEDPMLVPDMEATITATVYFKDGTQSEKSLVYDAGKGTIKVEETE